MPFLKAKINFPLDNEQENILKTEIAQAVCVNFGYSEEYLLAIFEDNQKIYLRGEKIEKIAFIEIEIFGNKTHAGYKIFSHDLTIIFSEILKISPQNIYIKFEDIAAFSSAGNYFERV